MLPAAAAAGVAIIARVPLASGLLSGRYTHDTTFPADDHRNYNRSGAAFDVGETFAGVDFDTGVAAAAEFSELAAPFGPPAAVALRWVLDQPGVSTRHPRRPQRRAGPGQRGRRRPRPVAGGHPAADQRSVRPADPAGCPSALVTRPTRRCPVIRPTPS